MLIKYCSSSPQLPPKKEKKNREREKEGGGRRQKRKRSREGRKGILHPLHHSSQPQALSWESEGLAAVVMVSSTHRDRETNSWTPQEHDQEDQSLVDIFTGSYAKPRPAGTNKLQSLTYL